MNVDMRSCSIINGNSYFLSRRILRSILHTRVCVHNRELEYRGCEELIRIRTGNCEVVNWNEIAVANAPI